MSAHDLEHLVGGVAAIVGGAIAAGLAAAYVAWVITGRRQ